MNPLPRLRQRMADEDAVWRALREQPAPHVEAVQAALDADPPAVAALQRAGLAAVSAAFAHWRLPPPVGLRAAAQTFARTPEAGDALVGAAMAALDQASDLHTAGEGLELVLDWSWAVLRGEPRDLEHLAAPPSPDGAAETGRTRRLVVAGAGLALLLTALLIADPFHWFRGAVGKRRQKGHRSRRAKAPAPTSEGGAAPAAVSDSAPATREGQKKQRP